MYQSYSVFQIENNSIIINWHLWSIPLKIKPTRSIDDNNLRAKYLTRSGNIIETLKQLSVENN